ncbi:MAG TPA: DUF3099 domain-containing protein [Micromonosporaceae bacterium]|nr:DUF3099 domain-containing protein [Micromonosporaceae bacterium]
MPRDQIQRREDAVRITTAASSRADDIAARQKRYLLSMSLRSACFIGAVVAALAGLDWLWPFLIAGALILPYIAVVLANNSATRADGFELRDAGPARPQLTGPGPVVGRIADPPTGRTRPETGHDTPA